MKKFLAALCLIISTSAFAGPQFQTKGCTAYFSPRGGCTDAVVALINSAKVSVRMLAFNFTSEPIAQALVAAHQRGVDVQLVLDRSVKTEKNSQLPTVLAAGIPSWLDAKHKIAHNKVVLVDGQYLETGSFNYTSNAENSNGENVLICYTPDGVAQYQADWLKHQSHSIRQ